MKFQGKISDAKDLITKEYADDLVEEATAPLQQVVQATLVGIDSTVTSGSDNLITSGGVYNSIPTTLSQLTEDTTHRVVTDTEKTTWNSKQNALTAGTNIAIVDEVISAQTGGTDIVEDDETGIEVVTATTVAVSTSWSSTLSDNKVPSEKLTKETIDTKISDASSDNKIYGRKNGAWAEVTASASTATATLAVASWSNNTQTISVSGVTSSNTIMVVPNGRTSTDMWQICEVLCTAQATDSLTFTCTSTPTDAISVNIVILG